MARVLERRSRRGKKSALDYRPDIPPHWSWVWLGFLHLSAQRGCGMALEPIRASDIAAYLDIHGIEDVDLRAEFYRLVSVVDSQWLGAVRKNDD